MREIYQLPHRQTQECTMKLNYLYHKSRGHPRISFMQLAIELSTTVAGIHRLQCGNLLRISQFLASNSKILFSNFAVGS